MGKYRSVFDPIKKRRKKGDPQFFVCYGQDANSNCPERPCYIAVDDGAKLNPALCVKSNALKARFYIIKNRKTIATLRKKFEIPSDTP